MKYCLFFVFCSFIIVAEAQDSKKLCKSTDIIGRDSLALDTIKPKIAIDTLSDVVVAYSSMSRSQDKQLDLGPPNSIPNYNPVSPHQPTPIAQLSGKGLAPMPGTEALDSLDKKKVAKQMKIKPDIVRIQVYPAK